MPLPRCKAATDMLYGLLALSSLPAMAASTASANDVGVRILDGDSTPEIRAHRRAQLLARQAELQEELRSIDDLMNAKEPGFSLARTVPSVQASIMLQAGTALKKKRARLQDEWVSVGGRPQRDAMPEHVEDLAAAMITKTAQHMAIQAAPGISIVGGMLSALQTAVGKIPLWTAINSTGIEPLAQRSSTVGLEIAAPEVVENRVRAVWQGVAARVETLWKHIRANGTPNLFRLAKDLVSPREDVFTYNRCTMLFVVHGIAISVLGIGMAAVLCCLGAKRCLLALQDKFNTKETVTRQSFVEWGTNAQTIVVT